ncbi:MAG TPA: hypothetical protein VJG30_02830 [Candidatus Nanoarchaeia archaeon]|nr:hypothetical protein [Candidatus Nanoarchaeia archaeon]
MLVNLGGSVSIEAKARIILKGILKRFIGYLGLVEATGEVDKGTLKKVKTGIDLNYKILLRNSGEGNKIIYESQYKIIRSIYAILENYDRTKTENLNKLKKELESKAKLLDI